MSTELTNGTSAPSRVCQARLGSQEGLKSSMKMYVASYEFHFLIYKESNTLNKALVTFNISSQDIRNIPLMVSIFEIVLHKMQTYLMTESLILIGPSWITWTSRDTWNPWSQGRRVF